LECGREVVDLERDVRDGLDEVRVRRVVPIALPLDPEGIVLVITDGHLQMRELDLALEAIGCRDADVVELHRFQTLTTVTVELP
jgi:hypothetical protein